MKQEVTPRQLTSLKEISQVFKCSVSTVRIWFEQGAPIHHHSDRNYGADYHQLNDWLVKQTNKNPTNRRLYES